MSQTLQQKSLIVALSKYDEIKIGIEKISENRLCRNICKLAVATQPLFCHAVIQYLINCLVCFILIVFSTVYLI